MKLISAIGRTQRKVEGHERLNSTEGIKFHGNGLRTALGCVADGQGAGFAREINVEKLESGMEEFRKGKG